MSQKNIKLNLTHIVFSGYVYYIRSWGDAGRTLLSIRPKEEKINYFVVFSLGTQEF